MTFTELEEQLPNGFHDSALKNLTIDYQRQLLQLELSILVGLPDDPKERRDDYRDARVQFYGVVSLAIDSPATTDDLKAPGELWIIDAYRTDTILEYVKGMSDVFRSLPGGVFARSFLVREWSSYFHVSARDCKLEWRGEAYAYRGPRQHFLPGEAINP